MSLRIGGSNWVDANGHPVISGASAGRSSVMGFCSLGISIIDKVLEDNSAAADIATQKKVQQMAEYRAKHEERRRAEERIRALREEGYARGMFGRVIGYKHAAEIERLESSLWPYLPPPDDTWVDQARAEQEKFRSLARVALIGQGDIPLKAEAVQLLGSAEDGSLESKWRAIAKKNDPTF